MADASPHLLKRLWRRLRRQRPRRAPGGWRYALIHAASLPFAFAAAALAPSSTIGAALASIAFAAVLATGWTLEFRNARRAARARRQAEASPPSFADLIEG